MGKALKIFVVINLLLAAVVVGLAVVSFLNRQVLKAQALELEKTSLQLAQTLQWGEPVAWEAAGERKELMFAISKPTRAADLTRLQTETDELSRFATQRLAQLSMRHTELVQTRGNLADTKDELAARERDLTAARNQESQLTQTLAATNAELSTAKNQVTTLDARKTERNEAIRAGNSKMVELNNVIASLEVDLELRIQERDQAQAEYERCRITAAGRTGNTGSVRGKKGIIMAVNQAWQYVVINRGVADDVEVNHEALVHRGSEYVGKLRVVRVEEGVAVAQIESGSLEPGQTLRPGDTIFF